MTEARLDKDKVPGTYRRIASIYDAWAWLTESRARERCLSMAALRDGESVLEVAVGTGLAFERILRANPSGRIEGDLPAVSRVRVEELEMLGGSRRPVEGLPKPGLDLLDVTLQPGL